MTLSASAISTASQLVFNRNPLAKPCKINGKIAPRRESGLRLRHRARRAAEPPAEELYDAARRAAEPQAICQNGATSDRRLVACNLHAHVGSPREPHIGLGSACLPRRRLPCRHPRGISLGLGSILVDDPARLLIEAAEDVAVLGVFGEPLQLRNDL